jgi:hypothetical protein
MASSPTRQHLDVEKVHRRCESQKVCFASKAEALEAAEDMMQRGKVNPGCHIMPYACDQCGSWHVRNQVIVQIGRRWRR